MSSNISGCLESTHFPHNESRTNWRYRSERARLHGIIHRSNAKILAVDKTSTIILWNDGMADIMGISSDEVMTRQIQEVFPDETSGEDEASETDGGLVNWVTLSATQAMVSISSLQTTPSHSA